MARVSFGRFANRNLTKKLEPGIWNRFQHLRRGSAEWRTLHKARLDDRSKTKMSRSTIAVWAGTGQQGRGRAQAVPTAGPLSLGSRIPSAPRGGLELGATGERSRRTNAAAGRPRRHGRVAIPSQRSLRCSKRAVAVTEERCRRVTGGQVAGADGAHRLPKGRPRSTSGTRPERRSSRPFKSFRRSSEDLEQTLAATNSLRRLRRRGSRASVLVAFAGVRPVMSGDRPRAIHRTCDGPRDCRNRRNKIIPRDSAS